MISNTEIFSAYEYLPSPLIIFSNESVIYANKKALELLELPKNINKETLNVFDYILPEFHKEILKRNTKVLKGLKLPPLIVRVRTKTKKVIDIETKSKGIKVKGKSYILTIFYEVTKRLRLNEELNESKVILDLLGKSKTDIVFKFDYYPEERYTYVSDSFYSILGYKPQELYKNRSLMRQIAHPEDGESVPTTKLGYLNFIQKNNRILGRYYRKDKEIVWLETIFNIIKDKNGKIVSLIGLSRDVSREKEAETSLNITKEQLSLIANNAHDIIYFFTYLPKPKYLFISNSVENILGYKSDNFYKDPFFINKRTLGKSNEFKKYEIEAAKDQLKNRIKQGKAKYQVKKANGEVVWMEDHVNPIYDDKGKISFLFGIIRNITELKEKERELDSKWSDYKLLLDQSPIAFFIHSKGVCLMCNKAAVDLLKVKSEKNVIGTFIIDYIVPEQRERAMERMRVASKGKEFDFLGYKIKDSKRNTINVEIKTVPITYNGIDCVLSLVKDISEREMFEKGKIRAELVEEHNKVLLKEIKLRKEVEKEVIGEKKKLSSIFENSSHLVWTIDDKYRFTYLNSNFSNVLKNKYGNEPQMGKAVFDVVPKEYKKQYKNIWLPFYNRAFAGERLVFERKDHEDIYMEVYINPIYSSNGEIKEIACMANDISEIKRNQKRLLEQSSRINTIFESGTQLLWTVNKDKRYTSFNKNFANLIYTTFGEYPKLGDTHKGKEGSLISDYTNFWDKKYNEGLKGHSLEFTTEREFQNGKITVRQFYLHPIYNDKNEVIEVSVLGTDITKEVFSQKEIISQSAKLNAIFEGSSHYVWTADKNNLLTSFNKNYAELIKKVYNTNPKVGEPVNRGKMLHNNEFIKELDVNYRKALSGEKVNFEIDLNGKNNEKITLDVFLNPVYDENKIIEVSGVAHDISASKYNEEKIRQSLKEKEVLLKEVHHRVKNNMQIISSILNLQSSYISDENILNLLRESQNRIKTMAYIHESLYQNKTFSSINFNDYLAQLINNIIHSYSVSPEKIKLHINCEKAILNLDTSIPLGLIINELVTNSIKHAFPATSKGNIAINLTTQNKFVLLTVEDSGVGIGPDISTENSGTLGLQLVYTLIDQINGKISFERIQPHGTRVNIRFVI